MSSRHKQNLQGVCNTYTYTVPLDAFPRYRYFREHALRLQDKVEACLGNFRLEGAALNNIRKGTRKLTNDIIIVVIGGNGHLIPLKKILEMHPGSTEKEDTRGHHALGFGDTVGAFILPLTDTLNAKDVRLLKQLNKRFGLNLLHNLIVVETQQTDRRKFARLFLHLFDEDVKYHFSRFTTIDKSYDSISSHLEKMVTNQVQLMQDILTTNLQILPKDLLTKESIVSSSMNLLSITRLLDGWILELADDNWLPGTLSDLFEELHKECKITDVSATQCKVCYLVYRLSSWETKCLESCFHHTIMTANQGFKGFMKDGNFKAESGESLKRNVFESVVHCIKSKFKKPKKRSKMVESKSIPITQSVHRGSSDQRATKLEGQTKRSTKNIKAEVEGTSHHAKPKDQESIQDTRSKQSGNDVAVNFVKGAISRNKRELISALLSVYKTAIEEAFNEVKKPWVTDGIRLQWEMTGLLEESDLPVIKRVLQTPLPDGILLDLLKSIREVEGCGVCYGKLRVDLKMKAYRHERDKVSQKLQQFFIDQNLPNIEYDVAEASPIRKLCHIGVPMRAECPNQSRQGTLGGFATVDKSEGNPKPNSLLCALASRHVIQDANKISVLMNKETYLDIDRIVGVGKGEYDIAAISIEGQKRTKFNISFKNSDGEDRDCLLFGFATFRRLNGKPAHIWGAKSQPGRGKIKCPSYSKRGDDGECYNYVLIEDDQSSGAPFSQEGDSGAIVVADTPGDEHVLALSMLFGRAENGEYHSFRLIDGLRSLKDLAGIHKITIDNDIV